VVVQVRVVDLITVDVVKVQLLQQALEVLVDLVDHLLVQ
jgi:hypothetical protein